MRAFLLILLSLFSMSALAVPESEAFDFVKNLIQENQVDGKKFFHHGSFQSPNGGAGFTIAYTKFGSETGAKGSIVLAPGRTESSMKYLEAMYDLVKAGYSPIYAIDHRGQGFSDRMLENTHKGHVVKFEDYVDDFHYFVEVIAMRDPAMDKERLFLVSNSMGGAISVRYFQRVEERNPFLAAFHTGPMFEIEFNNGFTESRARKLAWFLCVTGLTLQSRSCNGYATPAVDDNPGWEDYDPAKRHIDPNNPNPNNLTHSVVRFEIRDFMWDVVYPMIPLGGPTTRWVWQATKTNQQMRSRSELRKISIPMVIMTGEWDIRADNPRHAWYCEQLTKMGKTCEYVEVKDAFHELLIETDRYRDATIEKLLDFFGRY